MPSWGRQSPSTVPRSSLPSMATSYACVSSCTRSDREMVCLKGHERRGSNSPFMRVMRKEACVRLKDPYFLLHNSREGNV